MTTIQKNNPRTLNAWALYDMANSVYSLCIATAIFPPFYEAMTSHRDPVTNQVTSDMVNFLGFSLKNSVLYEYALSGAFLLIAFLSPVLSGMADYTGNKKGFMKSFVYLGSLACAGLYFFDGHNIEYGIACFVLATIGFSGSFVFYNSYLPEIATPDRFERISARGYAMGYGGSVFLLLINLVMILNWEAFGFASKTFATQVAFVTVGIWWAGFAQITFAVLPSTSHHKKISFEILTKGFREIKNVFHALKTQRRLRTFLTSFFFISMGLQTVMFVASLFGKKELNLPTEKLIVTVMLIQLIAIPGAYFFAWSARKLGNIRTLIGGVVVWIGICVAAHYITTEYEFYVLASVVGFVMGGMQSLCRATFTHLLSKEHDTASYYSFYDSTEKIAIVIGTLSYAFIDHISSMRNSVLALAVFFVFALVSLLLVKRVNPKQPH